MNPDDQLQYLGRYYYTRRTERYRDAIVEAVIAKYDLPQKHTREISNWVIRVVNGAADAHQAGQMLVNMDPVVTVGTQRVSARSFSDEYYGSRPMDIDSDESP